MPERSNSKYSMRILLALCGMWSQSESQIVPNLPTLQLLVRDGHGLSGEIITKSWVGNEVTIDMEMSNAVNFSFYLTTCSFSQFLDSQSHEQQELLDTRGCPTHNSFVIAPVYRKGEHWNRVKHLFFRMFTPTLYSSSPNVMLYFRCTAIVCREECDSPCSLGPTFGAGHMPRFGHVPMIVTSTLTVGTLPGEDRGNEDVLLSLAGARLDGWQVVLVVVCLMIAALLLLLCIVCCCVWCAKKSNMNKTEPATNVQYFTPTATASVSHRSSTVEPRPRTAPDLRPGSPTRAASPGISRDGVSAPIVMAFHDSNDVEERDRNIEERHFGV